MPRRNSVGRSASARASRRISSVKLYDLCENIDIEKKDPATTNPTSTTTNTSTTSNPLAGASASADDASTDGNFQDWEDIREWLNSHSPSRSRDEIEQNGATCNALHVICRKRPPVDVVEAFIEIAPDSAFMPESTSEWLPLHIACAHSASEDVIELLVDRYPRSITAVDVKGRTPLHFAILSQRYDLSERVTHLLASDESVTLQEETGKIPLHYACAYGIKTEALMVLTELNSSCIGWPDNTGFTPFHYSLSNCKPNAVEHLISIVPEIINETVGGDSHQIPLQLLLRRTRNISEDDVPMMTNAEECLQIYLSARPNPTADFITVVQSLPGWLRDNAVVHPFVQEVLNRKMAQKFHTAFYFFDFLFLLTIIGSYIGAVIRIIDQFEYEEVGGYDDGIGLGDDFVNATDNATRFLEESGGDDDGVETEYVFVTEDFAGVSSYAIWMLLSGTYFLFREVVQVASLISLGMFKSWLFDMDNVMDILCVGSTYSWAFYFLLGDIRNDYVFRASTALTLMFYGGWLLLFLKSALIGFAVFISGLFFVLQRLSAFLVALIFILLAFAQMFFFAFLETDDCSEEAQVEEAFPFCTIKDSLLNVVVMLIGEVDDAIFYGSQVSIVFYSIFLFVVVVLLANVLIAIVTDSYGVIKNERSANVFWSNRLDFIAEIDVIVDGPWARHICSNFKLTDRSDEWFSDMWDEIMDNFNSDATFSLKIITFLFIAFVWMPLGIISAGVLLPPQIREYLFFTKGTEFDVSDQLEAEVKALKEYVADVQEEFDMLSSKQNDRVTEFKHEIGEMKYSLTNELGEVRVIMSQLFELYSSAVYD